MKAKVARVLLVSLVIVVAGFLLTSSFDRAPAAQARHEVRLQAPPCISDDSAQGCPEDMDIGEYLDDEAGISAWYESPMAIDLEAVRGLCQVEEIVTEDYLICSVSVPGYNDYWDPHVYIHTDGWILAYYLNTEYTGRIVNVLGKTIDSTLVEDTVATIAGIAGVPYSGATLYDFRYPNATHMLFVAEDDNDGATYTINMPVSYAYIERSWAKWSRATFHIDGVQATVGWSGSNVYLGIIPYSQLTPGVTHTIFVDTGSYYDYGVLIITYMVP